MSSENALRSDLAKAIVAAAKYPIPSVRRQMLTDAAIFLRDIIASLHPEESLKKDS